jgi:ribosomal-protein-alanine N-acetyltransferase
MLKYKTMNLAIRPMQLTDIKQVKEIEYQAFPTLETSRPFKHELNNAIAKYIIVYELDNDTDVATDAKRDSMLSRGIDSIRRLAFGPPPTKENIVGFASVWFMAGEAHLVTIAVRQANRGFSIGEYLLSTVLDTAIESKAGFATLEVRSSNQAAQALYQKYGFARTGIRKGYYSDTKEDAIIMTTSNLNSGDFKSRFTQLKKQLFNKMALPQ